MYAHIGWLFHADQSPPERYAPDLLKDPMIVKISKSFVPIAIVSLLLPALVGGLWSMSWQGAATAFFWGSLVRVGLLHHVTWSINSICHTMGDRPFLSRDKSGNVWWLAVLSFGESWHNLHHADPTSARHGVLPGQIDTSARLITWFEKLGWVRDVRWPTPERIARPAARRMTVRIVPDTAERRQSPPYAHDRAGAARAARRDRSRRCSPSAAWTAPPWRRSPLAPASRNRSCTSTSAARKGSTRSSSTARRPSCSTA